MAIFPEKARTLATKSRIEAMSIEPSTMMAASRSRRDDAAGGARDGRLLMPLARARLIEQSARQVAKKKKRRWAKWFKNESRIMMSQLTSRLRKR